MYLIFIGDANAQPRLGRGEPYKHWISYLTDTLEDKYPGASRNRNFVTYGHANNTNRFTPKRIDYLMYWASQDISMCTHSFELPHYSTVKDNGERISISDHEGLSAEYWIERKSSGGSGSTHCVKDASYDV